MRQPVGVSSEFSKLIPDDRGWKDVQFGGPDIRTGSGFHFSKKGLVRMTEGTSSYIHD